MAKERLRENFYISKENAVELPFQESAKLVEDAKGNKYSHHGVYEVDISRYDHKNLNGRVYSKKLWRMWSKNKRVFGKVLLVFLITLQKKDPPRISSVSGGT
jgi:hypothetical protein